MNDHFSQSSLAHILEADSSRKDLLKRRESTTLELKANFSVSAFATYARTMAAFSNRAGGYILFGVKNNPHLLIGMTNDRFDSLDPNRLTQFLTNHFSPPIIWDHVAHTIDGKRFGVIYTHQAPVKPVMCIQGAEPIRDGDIFYRYQGETRRITSADLQNLIATTLERERRSWRDLLARTSKSTPSATYLLDVADGRASGEGRSFVIGQELLEKIKFIHEGSILTDGGEPTLRVVGDVEVVRTEAVPGVTQEVPIDPSKYCTLWESDVVRKFKERAGERISFGPAGERDMNGYYFRRAVEAHKIPSPSKLYYRPAIAGGRPQYGEEMVDWLVDEYQKNPDFFLDATQA